MILWMMDISMASPTERNGKIRIGEGREITLDIKRINIKKG